MAGNGRGKVLGTSSKYDKGLSVLEQYDLTSEITYRGRGTILCVTEQGLKMIKPHTGSVRRLEKMNQILEHLQECGHTHLDLVLKNKEGELVSTDKDGYSYVVKNWWEARECDVRLESDVLTCMEKMAALHRDMQGLSFEDDGCEKENLLEEYEKHNRQLKKIRTYIRSRKQKQVFEYGYLESVERYLVYGEAAIRGLQNIEYLNLRQIDLQRRTLCHGMCNQHNFLMLEEDTAMVNFDHFFFGNHMADVSQMLRKMMEKHNWNLSLAHRMLESYDRIKPITKEEWQLLGIRMSYPEKYWKIANYYYNNSKSFLPEKNLEKLQVFIRQESKWLDFLESLFSISY